MSKQNPFCLAHRTSYVS